MRHLRSMRLPSNKQPHRQVVPLVKNMRRRRRRRRVGRFLCHQRLWSLINCSVLRLVYRAVPKPVRQVGKGPNRYLLSQFRVMAVGKRHLLQGREEAPVEWKKANQLPWQQTHKIRNQLIL